MGLIPEIVVANMHIKRDDIINPDDSAWTRRTYAIYNEYGLLCVVFADCEQDAFDEAADRNRMRGHRIDWDDPDFDITLGQYNGEEVSYFGNNGIPYDTTNLRALELPKSEVEKLLAE